MDVCGQLVNDATSNIYNIDSIIQVVKYSPFGEIGAINLMNCQV